MTDDPRAEEAAEHIRRISDAEHKPAASRAEAWERAQAAASPETAAVTHGGYAQGALHCDACGIAEHCPEREVAGICVRDEAYTADRRRLLAVAVQVSGQDLALHEGLIERAVTTGLVIERMIRYLAVFGDVERKQLARGIVKQQPGTDLLLKAIAVERRALEALNLTPEAIVRIAAPPGQRPPAPGGPPALGEGDVHDADFEVGPAGPTWVDQMVAVIEKEERDAGDAGEDGEGGEGGDGDETIDAEFEEGED